MMMSVMFAVAVISLPMAAKGETYTMDTYYPSPVGVYTNVTVTSSTVLARDGGNVGVGTSAPAAKLDVRGGINANGGVRFGNQGTVTACAAANEGTQRYNSSAKCMEFCDGASWRSVSTSGTGINGFLKFCTHRECGDNGHPPCPCEEWTCTSPNPFTGDCSCPGGTVDRLATYGIDMSAALRHPAVHLCFSTEITPPVH